MSMDIFLAALAVTFAVIAAVGALPG